MRLFAALYDPLMAWSRPPHAAWHLGGLGFAESAFVPIASAVMLAPKSVDTIGGVMVTLIGLVVLLR
ncbi:MAG: hypothetical protein ACLFQ1_11435 [Halochromatium sp.]